MNNRKRGLLDQHRIGPPNEAATSKRKSGKKFTPSLLRGMVAGNDRR